MVAVPRSRPPHLQRQTTRHGKTVWYVRVRKGKRVRLRATFGTLDFEAEYQAAITGTTRRHEGPNSGTLAWLIARYRETTAWTNLSLATRRQRENIFLHVLESAGRQPLPDHLSDHPCWSRPSHCHTGSSTQFPRHYARLVSLGAQCADSQIRSDRHRQKPKARKRRRLSSVD